MLKKEDFHLFVNLLMKSYDVVAPTNNKALVVYSKVSSPDQIELGKNSFYPPKKYFLPKAETLLSYQKKKPLIGGEKDNIKQVIDTKKQVILGMRMCDVSAVNHMDHFYLSDYTDPYYKAKRENTFIIALKCNKEDGDNCFCTSFEHKDEGYDLYLEQTEEGFIVDVKTKKGMSLIDKKIFKGSLREANKQLPSCTLKLSTMHIKKDSPAWQKYADKCLSCSACNIVCPTCGCFDIQDKPALDMKSGKRIRVWDFCQSADYTRVAGNHIFRQGRLERFKHRLLCKFEYFKKNFGDVTCTGCGRCITACPTGVCDIPNILSDVNE